jgi:hypothetical protein
MTCGMPIHGQGRTTCVMQAMPADNQRLPAGSQVQMKNAATAARASNENGCCIHRKYGHKNEK